MNSFYRYSFHKDSGALPVFVTIARSLYDALNKFDSQSDGPSWGIKRIDVTNVYTSVIAVIDSSVPALILMDIPECFNSEQTEEYLVEKGYKLSQISWGEISRVKDERETSKFEAR